MSGAMPGRGLLRIAGRLFDRVTLERVIVPAIADLQHECRRSGSGRFTRARAYSAALQTIALCAARDVASDRDGVSRAVAARMLVFVPLLLAFSALSGSGTLVSFGASFGAGVAARAGALLLLSNLVLVLPIAFYFAVALHRGQSGLEAVSIAACSCACVAAMALLMTIVPGTNQTYRLIVFEAYQGQDVGPSRPLSLAKGLTEMSLAELNDQIAHPPSASEETRARYHRQERFAYTAAPMVLGFVALALARLRRPRAVTAALAVTLGVLYYATFIDDLFHVATAAAARAWAANALFVLIGLALVSRRGACADAEAWRRVGGETKG